MLLRKLTFQPIFGTRKLHTGFKRSSGLNNNGRRTILSVGRRIHKTLYKPLCLLPGPGFRLGILIKNEPRGHLPGLTSVFLFSSGIWTRTLTNSGSKVTDFTMVCPNNYNLKHYLPVTNLWWKLISSLIPTTKICQLSFSNNKPSLVLAIGSAAIIVVPEIFKKFTLITLPSSQLFLINKDTYAIEGSPEISSVRCWQPSTKAGFWRNLGHKPTVRGTVKNPRDHPHGGRTRSQKCQKTPWGRPAKKSRQARYLRPGGRGLR